MRQIQTSSACRRRIGWVLLEEAHKSTGGHES
jgi:hypothetical protein